MNLGARVFRARIISETQVMHRCRFRDKRPRIRMAFTRWLTRRLFAIALLMVGGGSFASESAQPNQPVNIGPTVAQLLRENEEEEIALSVSPSDTAAQNLFCQQIFDALKTNSPLINYPEPVIRTNDIKNPAFKRYEQCGSVENDDKYRMEPGYFFFIDSEIGTTGFRIYRLDIDGNPMNGLEEVLYGEQKTDGGTQPNPHANHIYARIAVNADGCRYLRGIQSSSPTGPPWNLDSYDAVISYRNRYFVLGVSGSHDTDPPRASHLTLFTLKEAPDVSSLVANVECSWSSRNKN